MNGTHKKIRSSLKGSRSFLVILALALHFVCSSPIWAVEVFFSPGPDCENRIVNAIGNAQKQIVAAVYSINNSRIVSALKEATKRGVAVRILTDRIQASNHSSRAKDLADAGVPLRVHSVNKIEHNKFGVFDGKLAITGSFNWTNAASYTNSENCVVLQEENAIRAYSTRFEKLWKENTEEKSIGFFEALSAKKNSVAAKTDEK